MRELLQTNLIHRHYLSVGGRNGFGFPISQVQFAGDTAIRRFRGGEIHVLDGKAQAFPTLEASVRFLGFKCVKESTNDGLSPHDEPYFVIAIDTGNGAPATKKFGPFEKIDTDSEVGVAELLIQKVVPNPMAIRVLGYEHDDGDPDETAKKIQDEVVKLSQQAGSLTSAADAADGPGIGPGAAAGTVGAIAGGPIGALIATAIVSVLDLGDDFVGQAAALVFAAPRERWRTSNPGPIPREQFQ